MNSQRYLSILLVCLAFCGCSREDVSADRQGDQTPSQAVDAVPESTRARETVESNLANAGLREGYDCENGAVVRIGTYNTAVRDIASLNEAFRQVAYKKALLKALSGVAETISLEVSSSGENRQAFRSDVTHVIGDMPLAGFQVLTDAESLDVHGDMHGYQLALAVLWSKEMAAFAKSVMTGEPQKKVKPGTLSIEDWVAAQSDRQSLGSKCIVDNSGCRWFVGTVTVDDSMRKYVETWFGDGAKVDLEGKLRAYALDGIARMLAVDISCQESLERFGSNTGGKARSARTGRVDATGDEEGNGMFLTSFRDAGDTVCCRYDGRAEGEDEGLSECLSSTCICRPGFQIDPSDARVKWFKLKTHNVFTGKQVETWIGAVSSNDLAGGGR